jgi:two-component system nitrogen regulation response regulator GlnG
VRELQSVLKQALLNASGTVLLPAFLPDLRLRSESRESPASNGQGLHLPTFIRTHISVQVGDLYAHTHDQVDRVLFSYVLDYTGGNQREAAKLLGISRQTMRVKLRALGMQVTHTVEMNDS